MMWRDGSNYGLLCREVIEEAGNRVIARVWTRQFSLGSRSVEPYPQGEANFDLILKAPQMLAALCSIRDKAECYLQPLADHPSVNRARWEAVRDQAVTAIAAVKGENNELV